MREALKSVVEPAGESEEIDVEPACRGVVRVRGDGDFLERDRVSQSSLGKSLVRRHADSIRTNSSKS